MTDRQIISAPRDADAEAYGHGLVDLLHPRLGAEVVFASDDFFAPKERMLDPEPPVFRTGEYDTNGKWMDGWESRRRRAGGHDHAIVRLGVPAVVQRVDLDTSFFTGNFPPAAAIDGCLSTDRIPDAAADWQPLLPRADLQGDRHNLFTLTGGGPVSHLRLSIFPDGGIARFRAYGVVAFDWSAQDDSAVDLVALERGGCALAWSDSHYGAPNALLAPGGGVNMGDGWETRRRRGPGYDWVLLRLGHPGRIESVVVDTAHFKGNFPHSCALQAGLAGDGDVAAIAAAAEAWPTLLPQTELAADSEHVFDTLADLGPVDHIRFCIHPDGGVSRLRLIGRPAR